MKPFGVPLMVACCCSVVACGDVEEGVGRCRYGEFPDQVGVVTITSISEPQAHPGSVTTRDIGVAGLVNGTVVILESDFSVCFTAAGVGVGAEVPARIVAGGPCPPTVALATCPPGAVGGN